MATGVSTANITSATTITEVVGNQRLDADTVQTVRVPIDAVANQMVGDGPIADEIAAIRAEQVAGDAAVEAKITANNLGATQATSAEAVAGTNTTHWMSPSADRAALTAGVDLGHVFRTSVTGLAGTKYAQIRKLRLFGADPTKKYFVYQFYFADSGSRCGFVVAQVDADGVSNQVTVCQYYVASGAAFTGEVELALGQQNSSGITGTVVIDFGTGTAITNTNGTFATTGLRTTCLATSTKEADYVQWVATRAHELGFFVDRAQSDSSATLATIVARLRQIELYGATTSKKYYLKYFNYHDYSTTRILITVSQVDADGASNAVDVCGINIASGTAYTGMAEITLSEQNSSGITGTAVIDFGDGSGTWSTNAGSYVTTGLRHDRLFDNSAKTARIVKVINDAQAAGAFTPGWKKPFDDTMTTDALRAFVKKLWVFNGDPTHQYIVSRVNKTAAYARIWIKDLTSGVDQIAQFTVTNPTIANLPSRIKAYAVYSGTPSAQMPTYAVLEVDWSKWTSGSEATYTTFAAAGIHADNVFSPESSAMYFRDDGAEKVIKVGTDSGCDYASLSAALTALDLTNNVAGGTYSGPFFKGMTHESSPLRRVEIQLLTSSESAQTIDGVTYPDCFGLGGLYLPEHVQIRGRGKHQTLIYGTDGTKPTLQACADHKLFDLSVLANSGDGGSDAGQYAVHVDPAACGVADMAGVRRRMKWRNVELVGGGLQNSRLLGGGVYSGTHFVREGCSAKSLNAGYSTFAILQHNTSVFRSPRPAFLEERGCSCDIERYAQLRLQSLGAGYRNTMLIEDVGYSGIVIENVGDYADLARKRREWDLIGHHDGPVITYDAGMVVLATTAGQAVTGTAAALLFGNVDELGRGDKCVKEGASYPSGAYLDTSLAARLGDRSASAVTLIIGGQTATLNQNFTGMTNAAILAVINASLTTYPISIVNISLEEYPKLGFTRRMQNTSGVTIGDPNAAGPGRGVFVKRTGVQTIAAAADGDEIYGWCPRPILANGWGIVVIGKRFYAGFLSGGTSGGAARTPIVGKFGVGSGGVFSASASTKIGYQDAVGNIRLY